MSKRPITVRAAAALEGAEGLAAVGFGVYTGAETVTGAAVDPASAIGVTVLALAGGLGMLACARGLLRADQWSRAPAVLTQLFALPVAWSLWQSERFAIAIPLGLAAALALITVLSPPSTAWLIEDHDEDEEEDHDGEQGEEEQGEDEQGEDEQGEDEQGEDEQGEDEGDARDDTGHPPPEEPRSLGRRLRDRLKEQPTRE